MQYVLRVQNNYGMCWKQSGVYWVAESQEDEKPQFGKQTLDWENDMELKSKFIDRKV